VEERKRKRKDFLIPFSALSEFKLSSSVSNFEQKMNA
jgi:hypothetical protein